MMERMILGKEPYDLTMAQDGEEVVAKVLPLGRIPAAMAKRSGASLLKERMG